MRHLCAAATLTPFVSCTTDGQNPKTLSKMTSYTSPTATVARSVHLYSPCAECLSPPLTDHTQSCTQPCYTDLGVSAASNPSQTSTITTPCHATPHHAIPYHTIPYHNHTTPHHITPYHPLRPCTQLLCVIGHCSCEAPHVHAHASST